MQVVYTYNHLNAEDFLYYRKEELIKEIYKCIEAVDASKYKKMSCAKQNLCEIFFDQKKLNEELKKQFEVLNWKDHKINYYVTENEKLTRELVKEKDGKIQKKIIEDKGFIPMKSDNQVDFLKDRVAVEVQFGKYFSVAYDLHVKHTFFYIIDDIDVGVEIIPTHKMMDCMDSGVAWYENEVTNVIREGRNNPTVPILILGIEPTEFTSKYPDGYTDSELLDILKHSDKNKLKSQIKIVKKELEDVWNEKIEKAKKKMDDFQNQMNELDDQYTMLINDGKTDKDKELKDVMKKGRDIQRRLERANDKYYETKENEPKKLSRIKRVEKLLLSLEENK